MNKRMISSTLALALAVSSAFSLVAAATNAGNEPANTVEASSLPATAEVVKPSTIEQMRIDDMLKKYGLDTLNLSFAKADYYSVFTDEDKAQLEQDAKKLSMRGILDGTTMYVAQVDRKVEGAEFPYQFTLAVFADLKTGLVNAAEIVAYPYPLYADGAKTYPVDTKLETVDKDMANFMNQKMYEPQNKEHSAAKILGYEITATQGNNIRAYFKSKGWDLGQRPVYHNPGAWTPSKVTPAYVPFLSDGEIGQAMTAAADGGPQVLMMMSGSGFYFVEKAYRFKDTDNYFYIAFSAFGGDTNKTDYQPTFSWLTVRPAKYNMDGTFDKFIYPLSTDLQKIVNDMDAYFKTDTSIPEGAVN